MSAKKKKGQASQSESTEVQPARDGEPLEQDEAQSLQMAESGEDTSSTAAPEASPKPRQGADGADDGEGAASKQAAAEEPIDERSEAASEVPASAELGASGQSPASAAQAERSQSLGGRKGFPGQQVLPWLVFVGCLLASFGVGMLVVSIMERRWETIQPQMVLQPVAEWESDSSLWGVNYPREYESFLETQRSDSLTKFGGSFPRDYLSIDPRQVLLFAGYPFSRDFKQARGHFWAVEDVKTTHRTTRPDGTDTGLPATCWTCKGTDVPRMMNEMGVAAFYAGTFDEHRDSIHNSIGCLDCHDPATMNLRISRPALREAFERQGRDIDSASHQEMRSLVCAQCHVEYYFANDPDQDQGPQTFAKKGNYLAFPWDEGRGIEAIEAYYEQRPDFYDWIHPISGTRMIKMQHPDYEIFSTGIHAYRNVSCADCHMPYRTEGGVKYTDHHVQSPLLAVSRSCNVCHRWSEEEITERVELGQNKLYELNLRAEDTIVYAHFDIAACEQAGASAEQLTLLRDGMWRAQMRWDYVSASNGMGFHSAQECTRIIATALDLAQQVRIDAAFLLARLGVSSSPLYPDFSTREKAFALILDFEKARAEPGQAAPSLLP
ncbi:MAG: ammonia-forming cytochrome c nitrite reductase subunit c552 [Myxococcota bacterium]|jgi:nitrite reductase (cytochrome c-552)|nr:ammonia-forming cytochrome c nitrite reductase subunit c552 [Myxococcota bacterium]